MGEDIEEAGRGDGGGAERFGEIQMQFRRKKTDAPLDVPDAFTATALPAEQANVVGVRLRMIAAQQTQERCLAGAVRPQHRPALAGPHRPRHVAQRYAVAVSDGDVAQFDDRLRRGRVCCGTVFQTVLGAPDGLENRPTSGAVPASGSPSDPVRGHASPTRGWRSAV